jgi:hypothetical protein
VIARHRDDDPVANEGRPKAVAVPRSFELFDVDVDEQVAQDWIGSAGSAPRAKQQQQPDKLEDVAERTEVVADISSHGQQ